MRLRFWFWARVFDASLAIGHRHGWKWADRLNTRAVQGMSDATDWGPCPADVPGEEYPF